MALRRFTKRSDVWSFGICLWEIFAFGATPYPGLLATEVLVKTGQGYRLPSPAGCPELVRAAMLACWRKAESDRPPMARLAKCLEALAAGKDAEAAAALGAVESTAWAAAHDADAAAVQTEVEQPQRNAHAGALPTGSGVRTGVASDSGRSGPSLLVLRSPVGRLDTVENTDDDGDSDEETMI